MVLFTKQFNYFSWHLRLASPTLFPHRAFHQSKAYLSVALIPPSVYRSETSIDKSVCYFNVSLLIYIPKQTYFSWLGFIFNQYISCGRSSVLVDSNIWAVTSWNLHHVMMSMWLLLYVNHTWSLKKPGATHGHLSSPSLVRQWDRVTGRQVVDRTGGGQAEPSRGRWWLSGLGGGHAIKTRGAACWRALNTRFHIVGRIGQMRRWLCS